MSPRIPVEDRLFSLVLALLASGIGLTKSEILATVRGYKEQYEPGERNDAVERMFERDKESLRDLGVPVETLDSPDDPGNNQTTRYRIPRTMFELPADVSFTPEEGALLSLAARVWREGTLSAEARRALFKLGALGVADLDPVIGYAPRLRPAEAAFAPLDAAISASRAVRFDYLRPGEEAPAPRELVPLALVLYEGRWHLQAVHPETGHHRTYLLRRIVGPVVTLGPVSVPEGDHGAAALASLGELAGRQSAELEVEPGSDAALRLGNRTTATALGPGRLLLGYVDLAILADELAGFGPEVRVIAPEELRAAVVDRLERTAAAHG